MALLSRSLNTVLVPLVPTASSLQVLDVEVRVGGDSGVWLSGTPVVRFREAALGWWCEPRHLARRRSSRVYTGASLCHSLGFTPVAGLVFIPTFLALLQILCDTEYFHKLLSCLKQLQKILLFAPKIPCPHFLESCPRQGFRRQQIALGEQALAGWQSCPRWEGQMDSSGRKEGG